MAQLEGDKLDLIVKHLSGETSPFEEQLLQEWLSERSVNREAFEALQKTWKVTGNSQQDFEPDVDLAWKKVRMKTALDLQKPDDTPVRSLGGPAKNYFWKIAASLLLLVASVWSLNQYVGKQQEAFEIATLERQELFYLPDSSKVWLNKYSSISYSGDFNDELRELKLEGEAFFEVRKSEKPFRVFAQNSVTEVLGTSFNVRAIAGEPEKIVVHSGKVVFAHQADKGNKVFLTKGMGARLEEGSPKVEHQISSNTTAWKSRKLTFDNAPLELVAKDVAEYFQISVILEDKDVKNAKFTGTFEEPTISEILQVLYVSMNLEIEQGDQKVIIKGKICR